MYRATKIGLGVLLALLLALAALWLARAWLVAGFAERYFRLHGVAAPGRRSNQSVRTVTLSRSAVASVLRSGSRKASASSSNTSPSCVFTPSLKDSVAVPKKCTWTSPGRRNWPYLK